MKGRVARGLERAHGSVGDTDDTASWSGTSVTGLQGLLVAALAQVVLARMHHDGTAKHRGRADQLDQRVGQHALANTLVVGSDIAEVAHVTDLVAWRTVSLLEWVKVRACGCAAVGVVTELVNVEPVVAAGTEPGDLVRNGGWLVFGLLL